MRTTAPNYARLYRDAKAQAMDRAGGERAFWIIGSTLRTALVAQAILAFVGRQDESVSDSTVRALLSNLRTLLSADMTLTA